MAVLLLGWGAARAAEQGAGPQPQGVKVHGHWTLTVRNADGSVASQTVFDNALVPSGGEFLAELLTTMAATDVTKWRVALVGNAATYEIAEPGAPNGPRPNRFLALTVSAVPGSPALTLVGSARSSAADTLASVRTDLERYDQGGRLRIATPFTAAGLPQPTQVQAGQTIDVTVVLSFS